MKDFIVVKCFWPLCNEKDVIIESCKVGKKSMHPITTKKIILHRLDRLDMLNPTVVWY